MSNIFSIEKNLSETIMTDIIQEGPPLENAGLATKRHALSQIGLDVSLGKRAVQFSNTKNLSGDPLVATLSPEKMTLSSDILDPIRDEVMKLIATSTLSHQKDSRTNRATLQFGYSYFNLENGDYSYTEFPESLKILGKAVLEGFGFEPYDFTNVIVSQYLSGYHLEPHQDTDATMVDRAGYYFDEDIFGVILESDEQGHLYFIHHTNPDSLPALDQEHVLDLHEQYGDCFRLNGKIRRMPYLHGVSEVKNSRISVTFRRVIIKS